MNAGTLPASRIVNRFIPAFGNNPQPFKQCYRRIGFIGPIQQEAIPPRQFPFSRSPTPRHTA